MARGKSTSSNSKASVKEVEESFNGFANAVVLRGEVTRVLIDSEKVNKYCIKVPNKTEKGNVSWAFLTLTEFVKDEAPYEVGTKLHIEAHLASNSYEKNGNKIYTTDIIADKVEEI